MTTSVLTDHEALCREALAAVAEQAEAVEVPPPAARYLPGGAHGVYRSMITVAMAYFDPLSPRCGEERLWRRLGELTGAMKQRQHADGLIDLPLCNFHSPPDAAFMVEDLVPLHEVLRDGCPPSPQREQFLGQLASIIVPACEAIARGGVHTPNHRWKVASALTLADGIWPHERWRDEAQAYLDEGIDIDEDDEFTERSAGCYNYVCDRALILLARALKRTDLLACADRNLEHMLHLLHADGTLVTSYSRRQDRNTTVGVERYFLLYWYRALTGGNGRFLSAAGLGLRRLRETGGTTGGLAVWLRYLRDAADKTPPEPRPLPEDYELRFDKVGVVRRRRGDQSLTLMSHSAEALSVRFGAGPEITLRLAAGLAPNAQFIAPRVEGGDGRFRLRSHHACEYYGPGPDPLPATDWRTRASFSRRVFLGAELTIEIGVAALPDGLELDLRSTGCPNVPVEVAFLVRDADAVEAPGEMETDPDSGKRFFNCGELTVRGPRHVVRIGPGLAEHPLREIRPAEAFRARDAYCIRLLTPLATALTIRVE